jgi:hypothetical protein
VTAAAAAPRRQRTSPGAAAADASHDLGRLEPPVLAGELANELECSSLSSGTGMIFCAAGLRQHSGAESRPCRLPEMNQPKVTTAPGREPATAVLTPVNGSFLTGRTGTGRARARPAAGPAGRRHLWQVSRQHL